MSSNASVHEGAEGRLLQTEKVISHLLRGGVLLSAGLIAAGLALTWVMPHPGGFLPGDLNTLSSGGLVSSSGTPNSWADVVRGLGMLDPGTVISVGLIVLIALPVVRVAMTILLFLYERDSLYFVITSVVFAVLLSGILLGKGL